MLFVLGESPPARTPHPPQALPTGTEHLLSTPRPPLPFSRPILSLYPLCPPSPSPPASLHTGTIKSSLTTRSWWLSGLEVLAVGSLVAGVAFGIGLLVESLLLSSEGDSH